MEHSSSASQATASSSTCNLPPPAVSTNLVEAPRRTPPLMRLPPMTSNDEVFMEVAKCVIKLKAHRLKRGEVGHAWDKIVFTLWDANSGRLRLYNKPTDVSKYRSRFLTACESRCTRLQMPGFHSDSHDPHSAEDVPPADKVAEQIWMEYSSMKEATKEKNSKLKKRKAAFKETSQALCPICRTLVQIATDSSVERINKIQGNGSRTLSEMQVNEVAVLQEYKENFQAHTAAAATLVDISIDDDDDDLDIPTSKEHDRRRSLTKGSGTQKPTLSPSVDSRRLLTERGEIRNRFQTAHTVTMHIRTRTALYEQLTKLCELRSSGMLTPEDADAEEKEVQQELKKLRSEE
eukprot:scaffold17035_cov66-Attheya_sp.AAC.2